MWLRGLFLTTYIEKIKIVIIVVGPLLVSFGVARVVPMDKTNSVLSAIILERVLNLLSIMVPWQNQLILIPNHTRSF